MTAPSDSGSDLLVGAQALEDFLAALYVGFGASPATGREVAIHLVEASLTGHDSHGALRAPWYVDKIEAGELDPKASPTIVHETPTTAVVDGGWGFG